MAAAASAPSALTAPRITESVNPLTNEIDTAGIEGALRCLRCADAQIFAGACARLVAVIQEYSPCLVCAGFKHHANIVDSVPALERLSNAILHLIRASDAGMVVMAGAGTSGRLAAFVAKALQSHQPDVFSDKLAYLCAGGEAALLKSQESAEDVSGAAVADLHLLLDGVTGPVVYIGISCGMSATYVGAQAEALLAQAPAGGVCVSLLGLNPLELVPSKAIQGWDSTFQQVATAVHEASMMPSAQGGESTGVLLTPAVGPEAIAGSTRMKGGSATKLILETVLAAAAQAATAGADAVSPQWLVQCFASAQAAVDAVYQHNTSLARVVGLASASLQASGRVLYLGIGSAGVLGMIDASECPPTYGADFDDVRGFVQDGYHCLGKASTANTIPATNTSGSRDDAEGRRLIASDGAVQWAMSGLEHFTAHVCGTLTAHDTVVLLQGPTVAPVSGDASGYATALAAAAEAANGCPAAVCGVAVTQPEQELQPYMQHLSASHLVHVRVAGSAFGCSGLHPEGELALKLCLNAITTVAHVQRGCVFGNRMIDVGVTNAKLLVRAVGIIADVACVPRSVASTALLRCIRGDDDLMVQHTQGEHEADDVPALIAAASKQRSLVPLAILMCAAAKGGVAKGGGGHGGQSGTAALTAALPTVKATREVLSAHPVLRQAIHAAVSS